MSQPKSWLAAGAAPISEFGSDAQSVEVSLVCERAVAFLAGGLDEHTCCHEQLHRPTGGRFRRVQELHHEPDTEHWVARKELEQAERRDRDPLVREHARTIGSDKSEKLARRSDGLIGNRRDAV